MPLRNPTILLALMSSLAACSDGGGDRTLDCAWAASSDNCWLALVDEIAACAVPADVHGVFDAGRTRCDYAGGWSVEFDEPVPASVPDTYHWRFTVRHGADECVRWDDLAEGTGEADLAVDSGGDLVTAAGTLSEYALTCPDGSRYVTSDPYSVLTCGAPRAYKLPVTTIRTSPGYVGLAIALGEESDGTDIEVPLFDCDDPTP